jgi:hypothetical protein
MPENVQPADISEMPNITMNMRVPQPIIQSLHLGI